MPNFYLTVGQKYRYETHPQGIHPDGWMTIVAPDLDEARACAYDYCGESFCSVYPESSFSWHLYPLGEMARVVSGKETHEPSSLQQL